MKRIKDYLDFLEGKEIWCCDYFGTRVNLQEPDVSLCHDFDVGNRAVSELNGFSAEEYYKALVQIAGENEEKDSQCRKCGKCRKQKFTSRKLTWITINTSWHCNSSCIYCTAHFNKNTDIKNVIEIIADFNDHNLIADNCLFDWGGGEPTLNPYFELTSKWISNKGFMQRINTNAIEYSEAVEELLREGNNSLRVSMDSGSKSCFLLMKGTDEYERTWENIERYRGISDNIVLKYNICNYNSDQSEIDKYLQRCSSIGIKTIMIEAEVTSYQPSRNAGPFYYTPKEFDAMHYMCNTAEKLGIEPVISNYAFSYHNDNNDLGCCSLPSAFYDNTDREVVSNEIFVQTYPSISYLIEELKRKPRVVIWGYGDVGKTAYHELTANGVSIAYIVDREYEKLADDDSKSVRICPPDRILQEENEITVVLAGKYWREMLKYINENNFRNVTPVYMRDEHWLSLRW